MKRSAPGLLAVLGLFGLPASTTAQGLPPYIPVNPVLTSRSGLYFQPYVDRSPGWHTRLLLDYASSVEYEGDSRASILLDGELLRLEATVSHDFGSAFVGGSASMNGGYDGFLDGPLNWYHNLTGLRVAAREVLPKNKFAYALELPDGDSLTRQPSSGFLGDLRLFGGIRHSGGWQTVLAATLPTSTGPAGYGKETVSLSAITTFRTRPERPFLVEGSLGVGYAPTTGDLALYQRQWFGSASLGARLRFWGKQSAFVNLFYQSPNYRNTTLRSLDQREITLDYGFLLKAKRGPEWFLGMTEDLEPSGPAIDLSFRIGARW